MSKKHKKWWDINNPPKEPEEKIESLSFKYPLVYSGDIKYHFEYHDVKTLDYLRELDKIIKLKDLSFSFLISQTDDYFSNIVDNIDKLILKFKEIKYIPYFEYYFSQEASFSKTFIFIFSDYPNPEEILSKRLDEFYNLRSFL